VSERIARGGDWRQRRYHDRCALGRDLPRDWPRGLLREYAGQIGLDSAFTIHDREDSADLMNIMRHELGFSKTESRFPAKGTCLAVYSRCVNAELPIEGCAASVLPVVRRLGRRTEAAVRRLCRGEQRQKCLDYDDLLLYWAQMSAIRPCRRDRRALSTMCLSTSTRTRTAFSLDPFWR